MDYIQHTNLGYDRDNLLYVRVEGQLSKMENYELFKQRVMRMPGVAMVDRSFGETPHSMTFDVFDDQIKREGKSANAAIGVEPSSVGFDFVKLMKLTIVKGRDFSRESAGDSVDAFIVNEEAVKEMGWKDPIGKWVQAWDKKGHVIGVVKDFHTRSLRDPIRPLLLDVKEYQDTLGLIADQDPPGADKGGAGEHRYRL